MEKTPGQRMYAAVSAGNAEQVRLILANHPEQLNEFPGVAASWFHYAAREGQLSVINVFLALGLPVDHQLRPGATPLKDAVASGQIEVAKYLLSLKADPNVASRILIAAINAKTNNFALVKLLVEHGADVNLCWRWGEEESGHLFNALSWAVDGEHNEIADYLRAHGALMPSQEPPQPPKTVEQEVVSYFNRRVGPVRPAALIEIVPRDFPVAIHVIPPDDDLAYFTLFTTGMSRQPMTVPHGGELYRFAELVIHLPPDWELSREALQNARWRWPIDWLRKVAVYPHEEGTWLGGPITIFANGDPPQPLAPACPFAALLLAVGHDDIGPIQTIEGNYIQIYTVIPLYPEERELEIKEDLSELFRRLDQFGVSKVVDIGRRNVGLTDRVGR